MANEILLVVGRKGSGKTYWVKQNKVQAKRLLILDTCREYEVPGAFRVQTFDDLLEAMELRKGFAGRPFRIVYTPEGDGDLALQEGFDQVVDLFSSLEEATLVIDEIGLFVSPSQYPDTLDRVLRLGRHYGQSIVASTQRPADVPRILTGMADAIVAFQTQEPVDIEYLGKFMGKERAARLRDLPLYTPLIYRAGVGDRASEAVGEHSGEAPEAYQDKPRQPEPSSDEVSPSPDTVKPA